MNSINDIVDVAISIESPVASGESFSKMLLVVSAATNAGTYVMPDVLKITSAKDLLDYGYVETDYAYCAAAIVFDQNPGPSELFVTARKKETDSEGEPTATNEAISVTLDRAAAGASWYGFVLIGYDLSADLLAAAAWAKTNVKLFGYAISSTTNPMDISQNDNVFAVYTDNYNTSAGVFGDNAFIAAAMMAKCFSYDPGTETWAMKTLADIEPSALTDAQIRALKNANISFYRDAADRYITQGGMVGSGEWIDIIRFRDYLVDKIQLAALDCLRGGSKIPFNDAGITILKNVIEGALAEEQVKGGIDDDVFDNEGNVDPGYSVTVPRASSISKLDKKSRILRNVVFTARISNAIHHVIIRGTLVY